jgi:hypothetical protein
MNQKGWVAVTLIVILTLSLLAVLGFYNRNIVMKFSDKEINNLLSNPLQELKQTSYQNSQKQSISQDLSAVDEAYVALALSRGILLIDGVAKSPVISGEVSYTQEKPTTTFEKQDTTGVFVLRSMKGESLQTLHLNKAIKTTLEINIGEALANIDLSDLYVPTLRIGASNADATVIFSKRHSLIGTVAVGSGNLHLKIPKGTGVSLTFLKNIPSSLSLPATYIKGNGSYKTLNYDQAKTQIDLTLADVATLNVVEVE